MSQSPTYDQLPPNGGKILTKDNEVIDAQDFLQSGVILVTSVDSAAPVVPLGDATQPRYEQMPVNVYKIVNQNNEVIDVIELLESGAIKVQITGAHGDAPVTGSYITKIDETALLTNSIPLSSFPTGFLVSTTISGDLITRTLLGKSNEIDIQNADGSSSPLFSLPSDLIIPGTTTLGGTLDVLNYLITSSTQAMNVSSAVSVIFDTPHIDVNQINHKGEATNKIIFINGEQQFLPNNAGQLTLNSLGMKLASGQRVNSISNSPTTVSNTELMTAFAISSKIAAAIDSGTSFRDAWDASVNLYPSTGGSGAGGAIEKGNWWYISVAGTLGSNPVENGDQIFALDGTPGQSDSNWLVVIQKVDSVFGRLGVVVAQNGDYAFTQISGIASEAQGGTGKSTYAVGDILISESVDTLSKLPIGNPGEVLTVSGASAQWSPITTASDRYFDGLIIENPEVSISSDGATVSLSLEREGGGDLTIVYSTGSYILDTTPALTIELTQGTDAIPVQNYIYIPIGTKSLTKSLVGFPTAEEYAAVGSVFCQSAASAQTDGVYKNNVWTDHMKSSDGNGHSQHLNYWVRHQNATWQSGVALTPTAGVGVFSISTSAGSILQLHIHDYPSFDTSTGSHVYVPNDSVTTYDRVTDLTTILTDSLGVSLSGRRFNLVVWGCVSQESGECQMFINLPDGSYNSDSASIDDVSSTSSYNIPFEFIGSGFLISRLTVRHQAAAGGTWSILNNSDLRSLTPASAGGGGTGGLKEIEEDTLPKLGGDLDLNGFNIINNFISVTTATQALSVNTTYYTTYAGLSVETLPETAFAGSYIRVMSGPVGNTFRISQNAGQQILYGAKLGVSIETTVGVSGYLQSTEPNTSVLLLCVVADTKWQVVSNVNQLNVEVL